MAARCSWGRKMADARTPGARPPASAASLPASAARHSASPAKLPASPAKQPASPASLAASAGKLAASPAKLAPSPAKLAESTARLPASLTRLPDATAAPSRLSMTREARLSTAPNLMASPAKQPASVLRRRSAPHIMPKQEPSSVPTRASRRRASAQASTPSRKSKSLAESSSKCVRGSQADIDSVRQQMDAVSTLSTPRQTPRLPPITVRPASASPRCRGTASKPRDETVASGWMPSLSLRSPPTAIGLALPVSRVHSAPCLRVFPLSLPSDYTVQPVPDTDPAMDPCGGISAAIEAQEAPLVSGVNDGLWPESPVPPEEIPLALQTDCSDLELNAAEDVADILATQPSSVPIGGTSEAVPAPAPLLPSPASLLKQVWGGGQSLLPGSALQKLSRGDGALARLAMHALLAQLPPPKMTMLMLLRLVLTDDLEGLLLQYTAHALREQMSSYSCPNYGIQVRWPSQAVITLLHNLYPLQTPPRVRQKWGLVAPMLAGLEGGEGEMVLDQEVSEWELASNTCRALRRLPTDFALRLVASCSPTTLLLLMVVEPQVHTVDIQMAEACVEGWGHADVQAMGQLARALALDEEPGPQLELDELSRHMYMRWVLASSAWLDARWQRQLAFEADVERLGLYMDTEEWPRVISAVLPSEGTAVTADAFGKQLPGALWRLIHNAHLLLFRPSPTESSAMGLEIPSLPPLALADIWQGSPCGQALAFFPEGTACSFAEESPRGELDAKQKVVVSHGARIEACTKCITGDDSAPAGHDHFDVIPPAAALLFLLLEHGDRSQLQGITALDLSGILLETSYSTGGMLEQGPTPLQTLHRVTHTFKGLHSLRLCGLPMESPLLAAIGSQLPHLRLLSLGGCTGVDDAGILALVGAMKSDTCHIVQRAPLRHSGPLLFDQHSAQEPLELYGPALTHLELRNLVALTDDAIEAVAERLSGLRELSLYGCRRLTDRALGALSGLSCPNLKWFNHNGAYKMKDAAVQCLLSSHPTMLLYNQPGLFGTVQHGADSAWCT